MGADSLPPQHVPAEVDVTKPSIARVYDAMLGGKDHFEVDRQVLASMIEAIPDIPVLARQNRAWLRRVVSWLVSEAGIDQFLDLGSGLPTVENTHEVAQRHNPDAVVVYVDNDPAVAAFGRALLEDSPNSHFCAGDYTKPAELLADPTVAGNLDLARPIAVMHLLTLHFIADHAAATACASGYLDQFTSGSFLAITHVVTMPADDDRRSRQRDVLTRMREYAPDMTLRTVPEVEALAAGLDVVPPGTVPIDDWWANGPHQACDFGEAIVGLVARKP